MKKIVLGAVGVLVMAFIFFTVVWADDSIKEGKWEITSTVDSQYQGGAIPNSSGEYQQGQGGTATVNGTTIQIPENPKLAEMGVSDFHSHSQGGEGNSGMTMTECVTHADLISNIKKMAQMIPGCSEPQIQENGSTVDYSYSCNNEGFQSDTTGHYVYTGETMQGNTIAHSNIHGIESHQRINYTGKYIGPC